MTNNNKNDTNAMLKTEMIKHREDATKSSEENIGEEKQICV